jgi:hypothetical protein
MERLVKVLESAPIEQQAAAAAALSSIADQCRPGEKNHSSAVRAVKTLQRLLTSNPPSTRHVAARAIGALGPAAASAVPALEAALRDRNNAVGYGQNPYSGDFSEGDYVSPIFVNADRDEFDDGSTVAEEIQAAIRKISVD